MNAIPVIVFRWLHLWSACLVLGGLFFLRFIYPAGTRELEPTAARAAFLRVRRVFKMVVHSCILLLLISGTYNAIRYWPSYTAIQPTGLGHGLFGIHLLLALVVFGLTFWLLAGKEPPATHRRWGAINVLLLFLTVAAASVVKYVRETSGQPAPSSSATAVLSAAAASPTAATQPAATQP